MRSPGVIGLADRKPVLAVIVGGGIQPRELIAAKDRVLRTLLVVQLSYNILFVGVLLPAERHGAAFIDGSRQPFGDESRRGWGQQGRIDPVVREWSFQRHLSALVACRRTDGRKVTG